MLHNLMNKLSRKNQKNLILDEDLFQRVLKNSMKPVGPRKVPLHRTPTAKKSSFYVVAGKNK